MKLLAYCTVSLDECGQGQLSVLEKWKKSTVRSCRRFLATWPDGTSPEWTHLPNVYIHSFTLDGYSILGLVRG